MIKNLVIYKCILLKPALFWNSYFLKKKSILFGWSHSEILKCLCIYALLLLTRAPKVFCRRRNNCWVYIIHFWTPCSRQILLRLCCEIYAYRETGSVIWGIRSRALHFKGLLMACTSLLSCTTNWGSTITTSTIWNGPKWSKNTMRRRVRKEQSREGNYMPYDW